MASGTLRDYDYVPAVELDRAPIRTAISPLPSLFTVARDALQDGRRGTPSPLRRSVLSGLRARDATALAPLTDPDTTGWPTLLDDVHTERESLDDGLQRVAATPGSALLEALDNDRDVKPTPAWDVVKRNPDRWLRSYVDALHRGWRGMEPLWRRSAALLEREEERISVAAERGVSRAQIVHEIMPRTHLAEEELRFTGSPDESRRLSVDDQGVLVIPIVAGPSIASMASPADYIERMHYPLRDAWRVFDDEAPAPASLEALLGSQRTALLQRLDSPLTAGDLAQLRGLSPSAITFHLRALEAAGLIARERQGRHIIVYRTSRGTQLLALYALP